MKITIDIETEVTEHIASDSCEANEMKPCGLSELVMRAVWEAVRAEKEVVG